jgi:membrane-bound metal-dependent hydrolase YbcI (DUF457 family)
VGDVRDVRYAECIHMHNNLKNEFWYLKVLFIMIAEHIIYSSALAILVGMVFYKYTGRDPSWIIIICAWAPDLDELANPVLRRLGIRLLLDGSSIQHGTFHNITFMIIFGIAVAFLLHPLGIKFFDSLFFSITGFGAHLFEDALVYKTGYMFLWPFSSEILGIGLLPNAINEENYIRDFFGIANTEVLIIGLLLLLVASLIRTYVEKSSSWIRWYMPDTIYEKFFRK